MKVIREEDESGQLKTLTFRADEGESAGVLKQSVKTWISANLPGMNWEQFFSRLIVLESGRITLNME